MAAAAQRRNPANALTLVERPQVLEVANRPELADLSPQQIVPRLADQGEYLAPESSVSRILRDAKQLAHRGKARAPTHPRPEPRVASGPNQVWSWDITDRASDVRGVFFSLYLIVDLFSRKSVGWEVHEQASAEHARELFRPSYLRENDWGAFSPALGQRNADEGRYPARHPATPGGDALLQSTLGEPRQPLLRGPLPDPQVHPGRPRRTLRLAARRPRLGRALRPLVPRRAPAQRHRGEDHERLRRRSEVYEAAKKRNPARWRGDIRHWEPVGPVSLNPGKSAGKGGGTQTS